MPNQGALANLDVNDALDRISAGILSKDIAREYGVTPRGLRFALAKHPDYKRAIEEQAHSIVEEAMGEIMTVGASDALPIARARARVDAAFKYAKAHNPAYADHATMTHELGESFEALIAGLSEQRRAIAAQHQGEIDVTPVKSNVSD